MNLQDKYLVPPYKIHICLDTFNRQLYSTEVVFDTSKYYSLTNTIEKQILNDKGFLDIEVVELDFLLRNLQGCIEEKLRSYSVDNPKLMLFLRDWMSYKIIGLERLMPLLIDDRVQEIYLDKPNTPLYLDHQEFGRCITNIILSDEELNQFKTRLCLEKDVVLNILNPSLKVELKTNNFHIRAAIDVPPLASDGLSMNIRKLRNKIWTLPELIQKNMLSIEAAAYLLFILKRRYNITIIGEPGSGKTTLANAIDLLTPPEWRKITVEDVIESIEQTNFRKFQTRYSVSPFESKMSKNSKSQEIIKLLHRSPTWVFLGEIQTAEHSKALFEALSAGLVGIQTCHGRSTEMMILRWINQHEIPLSSILTLDLLIEINCNFENWKIKRNVFRIVEISKKQLLSKQIIQTLSDIDLFETFYFDLKSNKLTTNQDLFETPTLNMIKQKERITRTRFENEIDNLIRKLRALLTNKIFDPNQVMNYLLFDKNKIHSKNEVAQKNST